MLQAKFIMMIIFIIFIIIIMIIIINNNNNLITKDLSEVVRLWKLEKVQIIPIVLSTTGVILKTSHEGLKNLRYEKKHFTYSSRKRLF